MGHPNSALRHLAPTQSKMARQARQLQDSLEATWTQASQASVPLDLPLENNTWKRFTEGGKWNGSWWWWWGVQGERACDRTLKHGAMLGYFNITDHNFKASDNKELSALSSFVILHAVCACLLGWILQWIGKERKWFDATSVPPVGLQYTRHDVLSELLLFLGGGGKKN